MFNPWQNLFPMMFNPNRNNAPLSFPPSQHFNSQPDQPMNFQPNFSPFPMFPPAQPFPNQNSFFNNPFIPPFVQPPIPTPEPPQPPPPPPAKVSENWTQQNEQELQEAYAEEKDFDEQYTRWLSDFNDWKFQNKNHPNQDQYKKFAEEWQEYESQMNVRRESIKSHIAQLLSVKNSSNIKNVTNNHSSTTINNQTQVKNTSFNPFTYSSSFSDTTINSNYTAYRPPKTTNSNHMAFRPPTTTNSKDMMFRPPTTANNKDMAFQPPTTTKINDSEYKPPATTKINDTVYKPPVTINNNSMMFRPPVTNNYSQFQNIQYRPPPPSDNKPLLPNPSHHVRYVPPSTVTSKPPHSYNLFQNKPSFSNLSASSNSSQTDSFTASRNNSFLTKIANNFSINADINTNNNLKNDFTKINNELKNNLADKKLTESIGQNIEKIKLQQSQNVYNMQKNISDATTTSINNSINNAINTQNNFPRSNFSNNFNQQPTKISQSSNMKSQNITSASGNHNPDTVSSENPDIDYDNNSCRAPTYKEIFYNIKKSVDNTSQDNAYMLSKLQPPAKQDLPPSSQQFVFEVNRLKQLAETSFPSRHGMQPPFRHRLSEPHQEFRHPRPFSSPGMHEMQNHDPFNRPPMPLNRSPFPPPLNFRQMGMNQRGNNPPFPNQRPPFPNQRPPFPNQRPSFPNQRTLFPTHPRMASLANRPPPPNARPPFPHQMMHNMPQQRPPPSKLFRQASEEKVVPNKKTKWEPREVNDEKKMSKEGKQQENRQYEGWENLKIQVVNYASEKKFLSDKNETFPVKDFDRRSGSDNILKDKRNVILTSKVINPIDGKEEKQKNENVKPHFMQDKVNNSAVESRSSGHLVSKNNDKVGTFSEVGVIEGSKDVDYRTAFGKHLSINSVPFQSTKPANNPTDQLIHPSKPGASNPSNHNNFSRDQDFRIHASWRPPVQNLGGGYNTNNVVKKSIGIEELLCKPGRNKRPSNVVFLVRGLPGSGKSNLCQLIKEKEVQEGGSVPRILSLSHYYSLDDQQEEEGEDADITYKASLLKNFKKQVEEGFFSLIIVKAPFEDKGYIEQFWTFAKLKAFQVYVLELKTDLTTCVNNSRIKLEKLRKMHDNWQELPQHYIRLNPSFLLDNILDVEMDDAMMGRSKDLSNEEEDDDFGVHKKSKWEMDTSEEQLEKLDGLKHVGRGVKMSLEEYLKDVAEEDDGKKKRVRWADVEEMRRRERGFMVGGRTEPVEFEQTRYF